MSLTIAAFVANRLVYLSPVDSVIVAFYFVLVLAIGWYLKGRANTGEDFCGRPRNDGVDSGPELPFGEPGFARVDGLGRWEVVHPPLHPVVLYNLHANAWWGVLLLILGAAACVRFAPRGHHGST